MATRSRRCTECPKTRKDAELRRAVEREWEKWLTPSELKQVTAAGYTQLLQRFYRVRALRDDASPPDIVTAIYIDVIEQETDREKRRVEEDRQEP